MLIGEVTEVNDQQIWVRRVAKLKKSIVVIVLAMIVSLLFSACANKPSQGLVQNEPAKNQQSTKENKDLKIALVMKTLTNPFFVAMERGGRKAEKEFGIKLIVKTGAMETSIEQQIGIIEELITMKVDAIVIAPGSSTELVGVLKKAQDANIKIVNIDNRLDSDLSKKMGLINVPFISVRNDEGGYLSAKYIADMIKSPTEAAIIEGIRTADNAQERRKGAHKAFTENQNIKIVASETANWKIDEAYSVASIMFETHPKIKLVFCANDMMGLGVLQYLKDTKKQNVLVAAFDNLDDSQSALRDGSLAVTIDQQPEVQGYTGIKYAIEMIQGKSVPPETYVSVKVITKKELQ